MNKYVEHQVFASMEANILCDMIHNILSDNSWTSPDDIFLTGGAAKLMQGAPTDPQAKCISFGVTNSVAFNFCADKLSGLIGAREAMQLTDQVRIIFSDSIYIEIWKLGSANLITIDDIRLQEANNIPNYIE